ncbi:MAG: LysR family transcriptional regulator [Verrucomicrobiae bacterium]|nr:LysR family transcriptional regulator [Verrucomicrobiae bacterium]
MFQNLIGKKNFSLDRLATLCHVAEAGSIAAATGDNANKQSLYSRQIKELESFLGIDLLDRTARPSRVSEQGQQLVRISRNYLSALDDFVGNCKNQPSKVVVGAGESLIQWALIPKVLPRLREQLPEANVIFRNLQTEPMIEALQNGEIDLGFVRNNAVPNSLESAGAFPYGYRLFVPKKFRAKFTEPVTFDQIARYPMAVLEGTGQFRTTIETLAAEAGVKLNFATECSSSTQVALLVALKECCAILPAFARNQLDPDSIDDYPVKGFKKIERTLCFAWSPNLAEIREIIEKAAKVCAGA